ncbi:hypothetical protein [Actinorugispora endophytica]|uniref:Uncharacterized protein n=1 Tax=Actinorugispora endophytica TaxID=1605990 RepID=A0A4V3D8E2_9ACTN|nr:hypothetical protein [Actinorugispora endophytica]TDQ51447.1 hypothetical protein EV190_11151 [Actinorugispora endophytica]
MPPGGPAPGADDATQFVPPVPDDAATQAIPPVREEPVGATQAIPPVYDDMFGGRPMFRDEVPPQRADSDSTAEIDLSGYDEYDRGQRPGRGGGGGNRSGGSRGRGGRDSRILLMGAGFAALLVLGGGGAFLLATGGGPDSGSGEYDVSLVSDESTDPDTLKTGEIFALETIEAGGETFTLLQTDDTEKCETTAHGDYGQVLTENDCRQVVRATYVNEDKTHAVTIGVAAMADSVGAQAATESQDLENTQWFAGLPGQDGSGAERLGIAGGHASGATWGRYMVFSLAATTDGRTPSGDRPELAEISELFIDVALAPLGERAEI